MSLLPKACCFALLLTLVLPGVALAGEVTLVGGDVLHGRTWKEDGVLHIDHPALGVIKLQAQHYKSAFLDNEPAADALVVDAKPVPVDAATPSTPRTPCCEPPTLVDPKIAPGCLPECRPDFGFALGTGLSLDGGNTDKQQFNLDADAHYHWNKVNRLDFRTTNFYEQANGVQTEGKYFGSLRYERDIAARTYLFAMWLGQRDDFSDILLRTTQQVGVGRWFIKQEKQSFKGEVGVGFTYENRVDQPEVETGSAYAGLLYKREFGKGDYVEAHAWTVQYFESHGLSPYQLQLRYGHPIREHLDITASFLMDYVAEPPAGIRATDTKFVIGLRWRPTEKKK